MNVKPNHTGSRETATGLGTRVTTGPTWTLDRLGVCAVATGLTIRPKTAPGEVMVSWGQTWWSVYVAAVGLQPQGFICPQVPAAGETGGPRAQLLG